MALCSQAFNSSTKRSCSSIDNSSNKRICFNKYKFPCSTVQTSSEEDEDSDDEQLCYKMDQIKAKRRASSRISFSLNPNYKLSKYVSQYSDEENANENVTQKFDSLLPENEFKLIQIPKSDKLARSKCFDYLVGAIDEAWARYCDASSCIEDEVFYNEAPTKFDDLSIKSIKESDYDDDEEIEDDKSEIIDNYSINSTDLTDISDHFINQSKAFMNYRNQNHKLTIKKSNTNQSTNQYQKLKDRLTKAKYFLQDLIDSEDYQDIQSFWNRWDMIKYSTIELVEDDDDDEVIESTIEDLEVGRYFVN